MRADFAQLENSVKEAVLRLPVVIGNGAVNWTVDSFTQQAWRGLTVTPWQPRSPKAKRNAGRVLLIMSGRLRRSIRIMKLGPTSVSFGSDEPYAEIHNNGINGIQNVRGFTRTKLGKAKATSVKSRRTKSISYIAGSSQVKPFTRNMKMPRRQFMPTDMHTSPIFQADMEKLIKLELQPFFNT